MSQKETSINEKITDKNNLGSSKQLYETKGVYGDEGRFTDGAPGRLRKMTEIAESLKHPPKNILDIGCGTGYFSHLLKLMYPNAKVYGVDISDTAVEVGRKKYKDIIFVKADAEVKLPFKDNTFDLIISGEYVEHIVDIDKNLLEINRVTKKGGVLIITTPNLSSWLSRILLLLGKWPYYMEQSYQKTIPMFSFFNYTFPNKNKPPSGHLRLFTKGGLCKLLEIYGFKVSKIYGSPYLQKYGFLIKYLDLCFSAIPSVATGLIISSTKNEHCNY